MADEKQTAGHYLARLQTMRERLTGEIGDEAEAARDAVDGTNDDGILHTHNADMDTEGVDAAVGRAHALRSEMRQVDLALADLRDRDAGEELNESDRARFDSLLDTQNFAEKMDRKYGTDNQSSLDEQDRG